MTFIYMIPDLRYVLEELAAGRIRELESNLEGLSRIVLASEPYIEEDSEMAEREDEEKKKKEEEEKKKREQGGEHRPGQQQPGQGGQNPPGGGKQF